MRESVPRRPRISQELPPGYGISLLRNDLSASSLRKQGPIATAVSLVKIASSIALYRGHNAVWIPDRRSLALTCPGRRGNEFSDSIVIQRENVRPHSRGAMRPSFASIFALDKKRAQGKPGARCTRGPVCNCYWQKRTRAYRFSGGNPAFPAQWFYGLFRALPGDRALLPPSPALLSANLTPASRCRDHTASPSATTALVIRRHRVHRIPPRVRDDREPPLSSGETGGAKSLICPTG
jgi:hypothetical protein